MKRIMMLILPILCITTVLSAVDYTAETERIRQEMTNRKNPNITQETHPTIYNLFKKLAKKAHITMPRYITVYREEYRWTDDNGFQHEGMMNPDAYVDVLGDMYVSGKILTTLSYEEIEGLVAVAVAAKALERPVKTAATGVGSFVLFTAALNGLFKTSGANDTLAPAAALSLFPSIFAAVIYSNNTQKKVDLYATKLTDRQNVINSIKALVKLTDSYIKEDIFSRLGNALHLKGIYRTLFYPVRAYTSEERIAYLENELKL